jgi:hypothetical protein
MNALWYSNDKICEVTPSEYEALCLLLPYWGLQISNEGSKISGALSTFMLGIHGLSQEKVKELKQLLQHTGIKITTDDHEKCSQRFYVDFHENHPMPLALKTPDHQLYYLNPSTTTHSPVQSAIHKSITLKRKDGPLFLAVHPSYEKQVTEWISYLVIQAFLRSHFEALTSISDSTFGMCIEKVLYKINERFAILQLPHFHLKDVNGKEKVSAYTDSSLPPVKEKGINKENSDENEYPAKIKKETVQKIPVPPIRPFSASGALITKGAPKPFEQRLTANKISEPINPFKSNPKKELPIQPFTINQTDSPNISTIRPFQSNDHTTSSTQEYTDNKSKIFRQRRDGK